MSHLKRFPLEALIWMLSLIALAFYQYSGDEHFTICPFALSGLTWCPGCGLGRSITLFFHGEFRQSLAMHPFGIVAVFILSSRIIQLTKIYFKSYGPRN